MINKKELKDALMMVGPTINLLGISKKELILIAKYLDNMKYLYGVDTQRAAQMLRVVIHNRKFCDITQQKLINYSSNFFIKILQKLKIAGLLILD